MIFKWHFKLQLLHFLDEEKGIMSGAICVIFVDLHRVNLWRKFIHEFVHVKMHYCDTLKLINGEACFIALCQVLLSKA